MSDNKNLVIPLNDKELEDISGGGGSDTHCGVNEASFPNMGRCCNVGNLISDTAYKKLCLHCGIWTSLPDGANLTVTHILECHLYGYGKRIKE